VGLLEVLLDKPGHQAVATQINIFAKVQARRRCTQGSKTQLDRLPRFARLCAADGPAVTNVDAERGAAVCLQAVG
jgi:hypothetical protein